MQIVDYGVHGKDIDHVYGLVKVLAAPCTAAVGPQRYLVMSSVVSGQRNLQGYGE